MISIIIPVYNRASLVKETVQSIYRQTYTDWELLLIDDGSTDNSLEVCQEMAVSDDKVHVFHKENGGLSSARNFGMQMANGDYISFIDSDDEISPNFLENLLLEIEKNDCDIVFCGLLRDMGNVIYRQFYKDESYSKDEYYIARYTTFATGSCCTALYKKNIITKYDITFPEERACGEDMQFIAEYIAHSSTNIITTSKCYYNYIYQDSNSITSKLYYDHYTLDVKLYHDCYDDSVDKKNFVIQTGQIYMDNLIRETVRYITYSPESFKEKIDQLNNIIRDDLTQQAIKYYKVKSKNNSRFIPFAIRCKLTLITYVAINYRINRKKYKNNNKKISSVWRSKN
jgi:glycosyltransferase involved in cell wall biosynthesis